MGYDYTYHLYIYRKQVWTMLQALGRQASTTCTSYTDVHLPGGEVMSVPFTSNFRTDPLFCTDQIPSLKFDVSIRLQVDKDDWEMFRADDWELDDQGEVNFGYLYLTIDFRQDKPGDIMSFRFVAATNGMSDLMEHSRSLQKKFSNLLAEVGGICGILELDGYREDEALLWWLKGREIVQWMTVPSEEEVGSSDIWFCRAFDELVERWLQE